MRRFSFIGMLFVSMLSTTLLLTACGSSTSSTTTSGDTTGTSSGDTGSGGSSSGGTGGSSGSVAISATANTMAQDLTVGIAMTSFSPLTPSGGVTPYTYSYSGTLPAGLNFNASTGIVDGIPTAPYATANVVFSVKDANNTVAGTISRVSFSVTEAAVPITATANTTAQDLTVGMAMSSFSPLTPSGGATPYTYSVTSGTLPAGLNLNTSSGTVTGTPTATYSTANIIFSVKDANNVVAGTTSTVSFSVAAAAVPITATTTTTAQNLTVGTAMSSFSPLTPSGGVTPYTFSITSGTLPAGLSLDPSNGEVTGTPTATYAVANVVFSVKDANNAVASTTSTVSFSVAAAPVAITATASTTAQSLTVGTTMTSFSPLTPSGGVTPYTFSIASGTLPAGLNLDHSSGVVTGTPTATYAAANVVFSVKDVNNVVAGTTSTVSFSVVAAPVPITATATTTAQNLRVDEAMTSFSPLTPSGGITPYTFSITSGTLPAGLNLDPSSGVVTGTPTATYATANVVFSVKDANNVVAGTTSTVIFSVELAVSVPPSTGWTNVKMGGGGYTPGVIYHPTVNKLRYVRTDMDGVYRWDDGISEWIPLADAFPPEDANHQGAESMAVDPTDANKVYMTTSISVSYGNGRFYYSSDQGDSWNYVDLPFEIGANNLGRGIGERLMVDPNLPSTLFYASRTQGLWKSTDSGLNWNQVTTLSSYKMSANDISNSNGGSPVGVEFVMFDTTVPTTGFMSTGSATQTIYVGVAPDYKALAGLASYLYKSTDGGASWTGVTIPTAVTSATSGEPATPVLPYIPHMARSADGALYVPFTSSSGPGSSAPSWLYKFDGGTTWDLLTNSGDGNYFGGIGGLSVYGSGSTTKIVIGVSGTWGNGSWVQAAMRSDDDGATWSEIGRSGDLGSSTDYHDASGTTAVVNPGYSGWVDDLDIDPFDPNHVTYVTGGGPWSTSEAFTAPKPHWTFDVNGIEEMVNLEMTSPPPGASYVLASAHGDTGLYVHTSLTEAPTRSPNLGVSPPLGDFGNGTGIDMAWDDPAYIVAVGSFSDTSNGAYSTDSGVTWTKFQTVPPVSSNSGDHSKVAVTADGSNIIWSISGQIPYYSTNNGNSWIATNLPAPVSTWGAAYHIVADRQNPNKVYAYDHGGDWWINPAAGKFYYSTDGGHTFTASAPIWDSYGFNNTDLAVNPFVEGDLWLADANNLWHSVDSGVSWTKLTGTLVSTGNTSQHGAMKVALGAPAVGSSYSAAVYFKGRLLTNGVYVYGVYRSDDEGMSWTRIDDDNHRYGGIDGIAADTSVYGRVFLAGRGMNYNY